MVLYISWHWTRLRFFFRNFYNTSHFFLFIRTLLSAYIIMDWKYRGKFVQIKDVKKSSLKIKINAIEKHYFSYNHHCGGLDTNLLALSRTFLLFSILKNRWHQCNLSYINISVTCYVSYTSFCNHSLLLLWTRFLLSFYMKVADEVSISWFFFAHKKV